MSKRNHNKQQFRIQQQAEIEQALQSAAKDLSPVICKCGCFTWVNGMTVKRVSKERLSLLGTTVPGDILFQEPQLICPKCGELFNEPKQEQLIS